MEENKKLVIAAMVILFGSNAGSFINAVNPNVRSDSFTGTQGAALEDRIEYLELAVESCQHRNADHREVQASDVATLKAEVRNNKVLIQQCMRRTGQ